MIPIRTIAVALGLILGAATPAPAQERAAIPPATVPTDTLRTVEDCLQCHAPDADLSRFAIDPIKLHDPAEEIDYRVDPRRYNLSNHGKLVCRICHVVGKEVYPHLEAARGKYIDCVYCHKHSPEKQKFAVETIEADFLKSVHAERLKVRIDCYTCHDPHVFDLTGPEKHLPEIIRDDNDICIECHEDPSHFEPLTDREFPLIRETHAWLPNTELHWNAVRCIECHTPHTEQFTHEILPKERSEKRCVNCHTRSTVLLATLYRYWKQEDVQRYGFINTLIFSEAYVVGVTRNAILDRLSLIIATMVIAIILLHALLRSIFGRGKPGAVRRRIYLSPVWLRIWHWCNAACFLILIATGLSMHFSDLEKQVLDFRTATIVHNVVGLVLVGLYAVYVVFLVASGHYRHYLPRLRALRSRVLRQLRFYGYGIIRGEPHPFPTSEASHFNPLQQLTYDVIMFIFMPILIVTGILLQMPQLAPDKVLGAGGIWPMAVLHYVVGFLASDFLILHIYLGTSGTRAITLYKHMITGWYEVHDEGHDDGMTS